MTDGPDGPDGPDDKAVAPDTAARLEKLVHGHREFLAFLTRRVGDRALAEDLLQEAFVRGIARVAEVRDDESVVAWFYRALRNAATDAFRRRGAADRARARAAPELTQALGDGDGDAPDAGLRDAVCRCVLHLADTLKPEYAAALRRIEIDGLRVRDFATEAGLTPGNAAVRVFRAREALRKQVARSCGTCAAHGCAECSCKAPCAP